MQPAYRSAITDAMPVFPRRVICICILIPLFVVRLPKGTLFKDFNMQDIKKECNSISYSRRKTLVIGASFLSTCLSGHAALASGGGDGGGGLDFKIEYDDSDKSSSKPSVTYTQVRFGGLSQKAINKLFYDYGKRKILFELDGFSARIAPNILKMGYYNRTQTHILLRDMRRIKPKQPRKDRLKLELNYSTKMEKDLKISVRYMKSKKSPDLEKEKVRLKHARGYKSGVKSWYRAPLEGSF